MLRNSDQQLLRFATSHKTSPATGGYSAALLPAVELLDVLDERISHVLLNHYCKS
jgi:hypothetical protein